MTSYQSPVMLVHQLVDVAMSSGRLSVYVSVVVSVLTATVNAVISVIGTVSERRLLLKPLRTLSLH